MRGLKVKCPIIGTKPNLKRAKIRSGRNDGGTEGWKESQSVS